MGVIPDMGQPFPESQHHRSMNMAMPSPDEDHRNDKDFLWFKYGCLCVIDH